MVDRDEGVTAANKFGWDNLVQQDDFNGTALSNKWSAYDGPGHDGEGIRSPDAISLSDGILTIIGTPDGTTGGLAWDGTEDWPVGGEVDYSEVSDGERQKLEFFLHCGEDNSQEYSSTMADMTVWNNYALEWTENVVVGFVNGEEFFRSEKHETIPPRPMHATIQLDWFPGYIPRGPGKMEVDWIRQYSV